MTIAPGTTSVSIDVEIYDDDGLAVTGLVAATFPPTSYSLGTNAAAVAITLSDLALITTAYASGGVKERSLGVYRLDIPNAALSAAGRVKVFGDASGKHLICTPIDVQYATVGTAATGDGKTLLTSGAGTGQISPSGGNVKLANVVHTIQGFVADGTGTGAIPLQVIADVDGNAALFVGYNNNPIRLSVTGDTSQDGVTYTGTGRTISGLPKTAEVTTLSTTVPANVWSSATRTITGGTITTNSDKSSYTLTAAYDSAKTAAQAGDAMALTSGERTTLVGAMWSYLLTSITTVGSIGKWLKDQLNFTYTAPDNAGINTKLDALQSGTEDVRDIASDTLSAATAAAGDTAAMKGAGFVTGTDSLHALGDAIAATGGIPGPGADRCTMNIKSSGVNVANAEVWITTDAGGTHTIAGTLPTDSSGNVTFLLTDGVTYYLWMWKDGVNPKLGESFVAEAD